MANIENTLENDIILNRNIDPANLFLQEKDIEIAIAKANKSSVPGPDKIALNLKNGRENPQNTLPSTMEDGK